MNHPDIGPHNFFFRTRHGYAIYLPRTEKDLYARLNMQPTLAQFQLPMARMIVGAMFRYQRDYGGSILQLNRHFSGHPANKRLTDGIMNSTHKQLMIKMGFNEMLNGAELNDGTRLSVRSLHRKTPQERQWLLYYLGQQTGDWFHYPEFGLPWVYDPSTKLRNASPVSWERHLQGLIEWGYIKPGQDTLCEVQGGGNLKAVGVFRLLDPRS